MWCPGATSRNVLPSPIETHASSFSSMPHSSAVMASFKCNAASSLRGMRQFSLCMKRGHGQWAVYKPLLPPRAMGRLRQSLLGLGCAGGVSLRLEMEAWSMGSLLEQKFPHQRGSKQAEVPKPEKSQNETEIKDGH